MAINIQINAGNNAASSSVTASGYVQHIITDDERSAFNIQDASLKNAVNANFGLSPNDAFVCSPTPWNDLYTTYGWPQVQATLAVQSARIVSISSTPTIIATQSFANTSSVAGEFNCGVTQDVSVTAESNWSTSSTVEIGQTVTYNVGFLGAGATGETSLSFSQQWGQGGSQSESVTLGTSAGISVTLQPGESVEATLSAAKGTLTVEVVYQLTLQGDVAVNYNPTYQGHHFWALDVNSVMASGGLPTVLTYSETIEVSFYASSHIELKNPATGATLSALPGGARPGSGI